MFVAAILAEADKLFIQLVLKVPETIQKFVGTKTM